MAASDSGRLAAETGHHTAVSPRSRRADERVRTSSGPHPLWAQLLLSRARAECLGGRSCGRCAHSGGAGNRNGGGSGAWGAASAAPAPAHARSGATGGAVEPTERVAGNAQDGRPRSTPAPGPADRAWPINGPAGLQPIVVRGWDPPPSPWAAGHRGVDLSASAGVPVRAAAPGKVAFAGTVAGRGVLTIELPRSGRPPLRTTYEPVRPTVRKGASVRAGQPVAVLQRGPFHCRGPCLHWGLRRGKEYLNPLSLLPPSMLHGGHSRLLPIFGVPLPPSRTDAARPEESVHASARPQGRHESCPAGGGRPHGRGPLGRRPLVATSMRGRQPSTVEGERGRSPGSQGRAPAPSAWGIGPDQR